MAVADVHLPDVEEISSGENSCWSILLWRCLRDVAQRLKSTRADADYIEMKNVNNNIYNNNVLFTLKLPSFDTILHNGKQQFVLSVLRSGNNLIDTVRVLI